MQETHFEVQFCPARFDPKASASWHLECSGIVFTIDAARKQLAEDKRDFPKYAWRIMKVTREIVK